MYPGANAAIHPDKPALVMASTGETVTNLQLDQRSNRLARLLADRGLVPGDTIALFMENHPRFLEVAWAAQRSGLFYTPISSRLTADEVAYIVNDCGARTLVTTTTLGNVAAELPALAPGVESFLMCGAGRRSGPDAGLPEARAGGPHPDAILPAGFESYEVAVSRFPTTPVRDECEGADLLYSSGTTGRPKGVKLAREPRPVGTPDAVVMLAKFLYGAGERSVYLSPAPLYHAAPLRFTMAFTRLGATVVIMDHFDPVEFLSAIENYSATHTQLVPTMFVRMLKLDPAVRKRYDLSSLTCAIHASAPCPVEIKREMIDWWGPVIYEYYAGTESNGFVACDSKEWLAHPGTVGRSLVGAVHILDDAGAEVPTGQDGTVYFEMEGMGFEYLNDPDTTASSRDVHGWTTLGDVGHLDRDGYLYLTDRKAYMIISGGVNIYPQEAENILVTHPAVMDVAVFGVPDDEMGEAVKAVVQPVDPGVLASAEARDKLAGELIDWCRERLAHYKCPRSVEFEAELPRHANGKLYKRVLRDRYWTGRESNLV